MTLDGETLAVATLRAEQVRAVQHDEITPARSIAFSIGADTSGHG
jgi:hypothetical protein